MGNIFPQTQQATGQYSRVDLSHTAFNNPAAFTAASPIPPPPGLPIGNFYPDWTAGFNLSWEARFLGPLPPVDRVGQRHPGCLGRKLR